MAPISYAEHAHAPPEWQLLGMKGIPPALYALGSLPPAYRAEARTPALGPLPLDPRVVRHGPRPSGWNALLRLSAAHPDPATPVPMAAVLRALAEEAARGQQAARGVMTSLDDVVSADPVPDGLE